ncbi:MAG: phosphoribosylanthranilate isomerase [Lachnospiraceae bacterium]|nr:phosphoribosylanthranilate isomerase [Lachnospiraceae bacterium]
MRTKYKICGLYRKTDIEYINQIKPDYCGFIIDYPKSHRSLVPEEVEKLSKYVDNRITRVGVFVDEPVEIIEDLLNRSIIDIAQLHGNEDASVISRIQNNTKKKVIKAFIIKRDEDIKKAMQSKADYILLDAGRGQGKSLNWDWLRENHPGREYFLAGGLDRDNIRLAIEQLHPYALDISSGVETEKKKDLDKLKEIKEIMESL